MDIDKLREWWWHRQALDGRLSGQTCARVLEETGWARSVGGAGPYLGLFARCGAGREAVDRAVAEAAIHELPAARGCTYVVAESDFALALKVGQAFADGDMKVARKLGVTDAEVDRLGQAVLDALGGGPLDPEQLRAAAGGAVRSLGEEGKKKGLTTTLPLALGRLQAAGEIRRMPANGRLDQQRYRYALWQPNPLRGFQLSAEEAHTELARRFFAWAAPATLAEFQAFSGLG
ncbi:MAG: winged helix DNA-binding domain-containing protein, partial [Acidobacteria bacterium]|nr:winged helix DNA-binding domain-containing protein [Acidobacteriota bacterium]